MGFPFAAVSLTGVGCIRRPEQNFFGIIVIHDPVSMRKFSRTVPMKIATSRIGGPNLDTATRRISFPNLENYGCVQEKSDELEMDVWN